MSYQSPSSQLVLSGTISSLTGVETTGIQFIPAPGAGKLILVNKVFLIIKNGSVAWGGVGNAWLTYGNTGNDQVNLASAFITNIIPGGTVSTNYMASGLGVVGADWLGGGYGTVTRVTSANSINKAVCFTTSNAATGGTGGTIDWRVWYTIVPAS